MTDYRSAPRVTNDGPIARLRMERGLTQKQLAEKVGCLSKDISRWENGARRPGAASLIKLANALGCTIDELAKGVEMKYEKCKDY